MTDLFTPIERHAAFTPEKAAVLYGDDTITYAAFVARTHALGARLTEAGVGEGDRVALLAENHPDTLAALFACARIGAVLMPLNWRLAPPELSFMFDHARPKCVLHTRNHAVTAQSLAGAHGTGHILMGEPLPDGEAPARGGPGHDVLLVYTSGTTGRPKGAVICQAALFGNAAQSVHMHQMSADDRILMAIPLFHVGGLNIQTTPALLSGATVRLEPTVDPARMLSLIARDRITLTLAVPAVLQALCSAGGFAGADLSSLRALATGSSIVPEDLIDAFTARGVEVLVVYGATETCPIAAYDRKGLPRRRGATGRAGLLTELAILGDDGAPLAIDTHGEIAVRGAVFSRYLDDPAATADIIRPDGFVRTGDVGSLSADGHLTVHGRKKHLIISGGENVYPAEVERVISTHPAVKECAVVGKPDPRWQEVPVAFVVTARDVSAEALVAHASAALARFKVPRDVRFVDTLPRTALGKVAVGALQRQAARMPPVGETALASAPPKA